MINNTSFKKKCDVKMCQNLASFTINWGQLGVIFVCEDCLKKLKKEINANLNEKSKQ